MSTKPIIEKWYKALEFPARYDEEFYTALHTIDIPETLSIEEYDTESEASIRHFLAYLYFCETTEAHYATLGVDRGILMDTLADLRRWTDTWSEIQGTLALGELGWLKYHLEGKLFRLGSLQFAAGKLHEEITEKSLAKGTPILEVHIPAKTDLSPTACRASFAQAKAFFARYFPQYTYEHFTCHSWMMDPTLKQVMKADSRILAFQTMFDVVHTEPSNDLLRYMFRWDVTPEMLPGLTPISQTAERVKAHVLAGGSFQMGLGVIDKKDI